MAVHVAADRASAAQLRRDWEASAPDAELVILEAARDRHPSPLLAYLDLLRACAADELTVVLPDSDVAEALHDRPGIVVVEAVPMEQAN